VIEELLGGMPDDRDIKEGKDISTGLMSANEKSQCIQ
jgi:hypothetical protein